MNARFEKKRDELPKPMKLSAETGHCANATLHKFRNAICTTYTR